MDSGSLLVTNLVFQLEFAFTEVRVVLQGETKAWGLECLHNVFTVDGRCHSEKN